MMDIYSRTVCIFNRLNRLLGKYSCYTNYRNITGTVVKEDVNVSTLNAYNQDIKAGGAVPVFRRALLFPTRIALQDEVGIYTYVGLYQAATKLSNEISAQLLGEPERTIAYMCSNDASHVIVQWAIWMSGNIAVPLTPIHPPDMLKYFITDCDAAVVVCSQEHEKILQPISKELSKTLLVTGRDKNVTAQLLQADSEFYKPKEQELLTDAGRPNSWYGKSDALIIYTSGTTSKPKGVVWTHKMLQSQIASLHTAWKYSANDVVLHTLPLHHIHGQLNSLNASLAAGARIRILPSFVSHVVWARLLAMGERDESKVTVFHGVPAMYARLLADYDVMFTQSRTKDYVRDNLKRLRLVCVGSAPLPDTLARKWQEISGVSLLERYGMSEVGMALSNPYSPPEGRTVGCVGLPLPGVGARIAKVHEDNIQPLVTVLTPEPVLQICLKSLGIASKDETSERQVQPKWEAPKITTHVEPDNGVFQGELLLKGSGVFTRYYNRVASLNSSDFTKDGWFRTGDTASFTENRFRILGRTSVDIIKTSGYKVSALQVESALLEHPLIADAAVLGIEDERYGEIVSAVVVLKDKKAKITLKELKDEAGKKLAPYQLPKTLIVVDEMPRNAMGKLDKKVIRKEFGKDLVLPKEK